MQMASSFTSVFIAIVSLLVSLFVFSRGQNNAFSPSKYTAILITNVTNVPGSHVATIGLTPPSSLPLKPDDIVLFQPQDNSAFLNLNTSSLEITLAKAIKFDFEINILFVPAIGDPGNAEVIIRLVSSLDEVCSAEVDGQCTQICTPTLTNDQAGFNCSCVDGYTLQTDGRTCTANGPSPTILLSNGFSITELDVLSQSLTTEFSQPPNDDLSVSLFDYNNQDNLLYFVNSSSQVYETALSGGDGSANLTLTSSDITGLVVDWISGNVIFSDSKLGQILQYHVTSGHVTPLETDLNKPKGVAIALDETHRDIFWFEKNGDNEDDDNEDDDDEDDNCVYSIKRASLNNGEHTITFPITVTSPVAMATDVITETVYWINNKTIVMSCSFTGDDKQEVYSSNVPLQSIAVFDVYVYLVTRNSEVIRINRFPSDLSEELRINVTGFPDIQDIHILQSLVQPLPSNDINECLINNGGCGQGCVNTIGSHYCSCILGYQLLNDNRTCVNTSECSVESLGCDQGCVNDSTCACNPGYKLDGTTCQDIDECEDGISVCSDICTNTDGGYECSCPTGLFIQPDLHTCSNCSVNNGGCSDICITLSDSIQCSCEPGFSLDANKKDCFQQIASTVIISAEFNLSPSLPNANLIRELTPEGIKTRGVLPVQYPVNGNQVHTGEIIGMDVDAANGLLYFGDRNNSVLAWVDIATEAINVLTDNVVVWGVAYDWVNKYVYWTEDKSGKIKRMSVNGENEESIITVDTPHGVVVEPLSGYLYWAEAGGSNPGIFRAPLTNFSSIETLVNGLSNPTGIAIDYANLKLIWAEEGLQRIRYSNLDGSNVSRLITIPGAAGPLQITITGDRLYWTTLGEPGFRTLPSLYDATQSINHALDGFTEVYGITVLDQNKQPDSACSPNPCENEGTCQQVGNTDAITCSCADGFTGTTCGEEIDPCSPNPCQNGGTCQQVGNTLDFTCSCADGFTGTTCGEEIDPCSPNPCQNGGTCQQVGNTLDFTCSCADGFTGTTCGEEIDPCSPNPCQNGGTCQQVGNTLDFTCSCADGFTGTTCGEEINPCSPNPCQNGGTCQQVGNTLDFTCSCADGFTGTTCGEEIDPCSPNPCQNGGTCQQVGNTLDFTCSCADGFTGTTCGEEIDPCSPNPCQNGGTCQQVGNTLDFTCNCANGFTGTTCGEEINPCSPNPCQNGGTCLVERDRLNFECQCADGYRGSTCDQVECPDSFTGPNCQQRECTETFCSGRGFCDLNIDDEPFCICFSGFTGTRCESTISGRLSGGETGGVSVGAVIGLILLGVIVVASVVFVWKVAIPYFRKRDKKRGMATWYLDTTLVRENPGATTRDDLLQSEYVAKEFKDRGLTDPMDNPIYGYVPPQVNAIGDLETSHSTLMSKDEWMGVGDVNDEENNVPFRTDVIPNAVIVNRYTDTTSSTNSDSSDSPTPSGASPTPSGTTSEIITGNTSNGLGHMV